ncbi:MAG: 16S rRNA (guanine(527)-N(7))-methyltransferase RsmG [Rhodospirillaceae bacterium]|nr:MAG: 16S rRNA (guanine(527)-N(7))-methyltransferase RsmG [Rhodospirillaceae bacterium]
MTVPANALAFQKEFPVTDEVLAKLQTYADLLVKWQAKINLVGPDTIPNLWSRHILDSAQLAPLIQPAARVVDIGSGAGFPGLVLAIVLKEQGIDLHVVESDQRKCAFMREVNRVCEAGATIHTARIEALDSLQADIITSRALASLDKLLEFADIHRLSTGKSLFLKGKRWREELTQAQKSWKIEVTEHPSCTELAGCILELKNATKL